MLACLDATRSAKVALVHGDLSPKNIFVSRADGHPVILDAECAWYGDPVFDLAFCLNHLLLKAIHMPQLAEPLLSGARDFFIVWLAHFPADMHGELESRAATLLPCLMLARVDGKSPVEYLTRQSQQVVRDIAIPLIREPRSKIAEVLDEVANRQGTYRA
jgi:Phosphotransferase enzyme family